MKELKNFSYNTEGGIDAIYVHPELGDIPYTLNSEESRSVIDSGIEISPLVPGNVSDNDVRDAKIRDLSAYFAAISARPIIDTGYGFSVQAGYSDLLDFQVGLKRGFLTIRAADNSNHTVTQEQLEDIIGQIEDNGIRLKSIKWALQDEIKTVSIEELEEINFEERFNV